MELSLLAVMVITDISDKVNMHWLCAVRFVGAFKCRTLY